MFSLEADRRRSIKWRLGQRRVSIQDDILRGVTRRPSGEVSVRSGTEAVTTGGPGAEVITISGHRGEVIITTRPEVRVCN